MKRFKVTSFLAFLFVLCSARVGFAENTGDIIKSTIDGVAKSFKEEVDQIGDDLVAVQDYLDHYDWKGILEGTVTSGAVTLTDFRINGYPRSAAVRPGQVIDVDVVCYLDPDQASNFDVYKVIVGYPGIGPQVTACSCLGIFSEKRLESFQLIAPTQPGFYEIRFRTVNRILESNAFQDWTDANGQEPDGSMTIGVLWVKS